ncbi:hypothetical protein [Actinoplanes aureus]|uniref:TrbL/VirB6 plasmid conjugal transfer protein n=1 Tax=Actinoplanes aureus TaxID=2792083 RepID=A0A931CHT6_9ACTN|nr:hypothetical protein [Actinoplanes aureus]MBG0567533.1 hypothetical protein [Actinoplanes aureus]
MAPATVERLAAGLAPSRPASPVSYRRARQYRRHLIRLLLLLFGSLAFVVSAAGTGNAAPQPPPAEEVCARNAPGAVAWCMPWAMRVETPPAGSPSHWVTDCSKATTDDQRTSCAAASLSLDSPPAVGTASVLMDGPTDGSGLAGQINCSLFGARADDLSAPGLRDEWRAKQTRCSEEKAAWAAAAYDPDPKRPDCPLGNLNCEVQRGAEEALSAGVSTGIQGLVDIIVQAEVYLLSRLAALVFTETSIASPDQAFYNVYNSTAGAMIALVLVFFLISTIANGLRFGSGPSPMATLGGLLRAVVGILFAGGLAYTIVLAWDQATIAVLAANASKPWEPSQWITGITNLTTGGGTLLLAAFFGLFAVIGLVLLFIMMVFRGMLTTLAALFGAVAMAGQAMSETQHWGRRWFWTVNALGGSKFFIAQIWIYAGQSAYGSDDLTTVMQSTLMIWLMVAAPFILLRLTSIWDGYLSDVNAHGILSATLGAPLQFAADVVGGFREGAGAVAGGAVPLMEAGAAAIPTSPAGPLEQMAGFGAGPGQGAAQAAGTGQGGDPVGQPAASTPGEQGPSGQASAGSGDEQAGRSSEETGSAQNAGSSGQSDPPGDSTGNDEGVLGTGQGAAGGDASGATFGGTADNGDPSGPEQTGVPADDGRSAAAGAGTAGDETTSSSSGVSGAGAATAGRSRGAAAGTSE